MTCDLIEGVAIRDRHMPPIPDFDDPPRDQAPKSPAHSRKSHSRVLANIRAIHRQIDFLNLLGSSGLELFEQLQEHYYLGDSPSLAENKTMALRLTKFLAKLANDVKFQRSIFRKSAP